MIYHTFQGEKLSALGMGCMRLPVLDGDNSKIDVKQVEEMTAYAVEHGINYFDTAWPYHSGNSETVMGAVLEKYPRKDINIATKFPGYEVSNFGKAQEIFDRQIEKLRTDYFDFYLFHNVLENNIERYLDNDTWHTYDVLINEKRKGRIRHLGFSSHGSIETMKRFLDRYGKDLEFVQIQLNWLDWDFQDAKGKVELIRSCGLPVWVMEPLRGGRLCRLTEGEEALLKSARQEESLPGWGFRFLQSIPEAAVTLSGMSSFEQMKENIRIFESEDPLNEKELGLLHRISEEITSKGTVPCTACRYCTTHCPQELNIPELLRQYNEQIFTENAFLPARVIRSLPDEKKPTACIKCGSCKEVCPQSIDIPSALARLAELTLA